MFNTLMILFADAAQTTTGQAPAGGTAPPADGGMFSSPMLLLIPLVVLGYMFFIRPMRKQDADRQSLLNTTKKHDKVITHAGIYGKVVSVSDKKDEDEIVVEVADGVRLKMVKNSILRNLTNEEAAKEAEAAKKAAKGAKGAKPAEQAASTAVTTKPGQQPASTAVTTKEGGA